MTHRTDSAAFPDEFRLPDVMEQAGDWLLRLQEDDLSQGTIDDWLAWYHGDAAHRDAFHKLQDEYRQLKSVSGAQRRRMARHVLAGTGAVTRTARPVSRHRPLRSRLGLGFAMATTVILGVSIGLWRTTDVLLPPGDADTGIYHTERGTHEELRLPDGSVVTLGARSAASYHFSRDARYVVLEAGEAYFEVESDRRRPFIVQVGGMTVRAVGTAFNIRRSTEMVVVSVSEGVVDVRRSEEPSPPGLAAFQVAPVKPETLRLSAGQQAVVSAVEQEVVSLKPTDPASIQSWKSGRLEFVDEPLSVVIATVNRYSDRDIVLIDRELGKMLLTGAVMHDHIDEWLIALPDVFPLHVEMAGDDTVLVSPSENHIAGTRR